MHLLLPYHHPLLHITTTTTTTTTTTKGFFEFLKVGVDVGRGELGGPFPEGGDNTSSTTVCYREELLGGEGTGRGGI